MCVLFFPGRGIWIGLGEIEWHEGSQATVGGRGALFTGAYTQRGKRDETRHGRSNNE